MAPTCPGSPPILRWLCLAFALAVLFIIGAFEFSYPPANAARSAATHTVEAPNETDYDDTGEWYEVEEATPIRSGAQTSNVSSALLPVDTFDDGRVDLHAERTRVFEAWRLGDPEPESWRDADSTIKSCTRTKFINGFFGHEPEDAMDHCLDYYESQEDNE